MALRRWGEGQNRSIRQGGENRHDIDLIFLSDIYREAAILPDMRVYNILLFDVIESQF